MISYYFENFKNWSVRKFFPLHYFKQVFSKLTEYGCDVWAVLEWECVIKSPQQGAIEGVDFIKNHIIETTSKRFDDFAGSDGDKDENQLRKILGI